MKTKAVPAWAQRALAERCEAKDIDSIIRKVSVPDRNALKSITYKTSRSDLGSTQMVHFAMVKRCAP